MSLQAHISQSLQQCDTHLTYYKLLPLDNDFLLFMDHGIKDYVAS